MARPLPAASPTSRTDSPSGPTKATRMDLSPRSDRDKATLLFIPLRDIIFFPKMVCPLFVGRKKSIATLVAAKATGSEIGLATQRVESLEAPTQDDLFPVATLGVIHQLLILPDGTNKVLVEAKRRIRVTKVVSDEGVFRAEWEELADIPRPVNPALMGSVLTAFEAYASHAKRIPAAMLKFVAAIADPSVLADTVIAHLSLSVSDKYEVLELQSASEEVQAIGVEMKKAA